MVIGEFSESYPPSTMDGVGEIVYDYVHEMNDLGNECYAIVSGDREALEEDQRKGNERVLRSIMHVIPIISPYGYTRIRKEVRKKVDSIPFDIVHAHSPFMMGRYAVKTARKKGIPVVITFHSQYRKDIKRVVKSEFITNIVLKYIIHTFEMADEVWAVNDSSADVLRSYGFKGKIETVRNFCNFPHRSAEEIAALREEGRRYLNLGDGPVVLFIGQQRKEKNLDLVLSAMKELKDDGFKCTLVSVGTGPDMEKYHEMVKDYGIEDNVIFTGAIKDRELLQRIYASADLMTFPSLYDNASLVIIEAAAMNVPSLLIENAVCAEGSINGENAFHSKNDTKIYAEDMKRILSDRNLRERVGRNAGTPPQKGLYRGKREAALDVLERYERIIREYKGLQKHRPL